MLGAGDVDFMDYNVSYYTVGNLGLRLWARDLYAYPAIPGQTDNPGAGPRDGGSGGDQPQPYLHGHFKIRGHVGHQPATASDRS